MRRARVTRCIYIALTVWIDTWCSRKMRLECRSKRVPEATTMLWRVNRFLNTAAGFRRHILGVIYTAGRVRRSVIDVNLPIYESSSVPVYVRNRDGCVEIGRSFINERISSYSVFV